MGTQVPQGPPVGLWPFRTHGPGRVSGPSPGPSAHLPGLLGPAERLLSLHSLVCPLRHLASLSAALILGITGRALWEAGRTLNRRSPSG